MITWLYIRESRKPEFNDFLKRLNKRATKLNLEPVTVEFGDAQLRPDRDADPNGLKGIKYRRFPIVITGQEPVLDGWMFRAAIDHLPTETGYANIIRSAPGYNVPEKYRTTGPDCDHCGSNRRRKNTFVLEHQDGRVTQVGSTCIKDFLGGGLNPEAAAKFEFALSEFIDDGWDSEGGGGGGGQWAMDVEKVLAVAAAYIRVDGWMSRGKARQDPMSGYATADGVQGWFCFRFMKAKQVDIDAHEKRTPTDKDREVAKAAREWAKSLADNEKVNEYEHNLSVLAGAEAITFKHFGLLVSAVSSYQRHLGQEINQKKRAEVSKHFGEIKKREIFEVSPTRFNTFETQFGYTTIVGMITKEGNEAVWFASKDPEMEIGNVYKIKATVKAHDEYKGVKQTMLTRCTVLEEVSSAHGDAN